MEGRGGRREQEGRPIDHCSCEGEESYPVTLVIPPQSESAEEILDVLATECRVDQQQAVQVKGEDGEMAESRSAGFMSLI